MNTLEKPLFLAQALNQWGNALNSNLQEAQAADKYQQAQHLLPVENELWKKIHINHLKLILTVKTLKQALTLADAWEDKYSQLFALLDLINSAHNQFVDAFDTYTYYLSRLASLLRIT